MNQGFSDVNNSHFRSKELYLQPERLPLPSPVKSVESNPGMNFAFWPVFGREGEHVYFFFLSPPRPMQILFCFDNGTEIFSQKGGLAILLYSTTLHSSKVQGYFSMKRRNSFVAWGHRIEGLGKFRWGSDIFCLSLRQKAQTSRGKQTSASHLQTLHRGCQPSPLKRSCVPVCHKYLLTEK